ncbi:hypothetical protein V6Z12_A12G139400 [Gossypium hirsutum]
MAMKGEGSLISLWPKQESGEETVVGSPPALRKVQVGDKAMEQVAVQMWQWASAAGGRRLARVLAFLEP